LITLQDYCPTCKATVEARLAVGRNERRLTDEELWRVPFNKTEGEVMHHAAECDRYWRLSNRTKENLRKAKARVG
jgi:hypothetical protein